MSREIEVHGLKSVVISGNGSTFRLGVEDQNRHEVGITFATTAIKSLMLNLFRVSNAALKLLLDVGQARIVYPMISIDVEATTETGSVVLVFHAGDGFEIAVAVDPQQLVDAANVVHSADIPQTRAVRRSLN